MVKRLRTCRPALHTTLQSGIPMLNDAHSCMLHVEIYMRGVSKAETPLLVLSCNPAFQVTSSLYGLA